MIAVATIMTKVVGADTEPDYGADSAPASALAVKSRATESAAATPHSRSISVMGESPNARTDIVRRHPLHVPTSTDLIGLSPRNRAGR
jgi:hypothetical protein